MYVRQKLSRHPHPEAVAMQSRSHLGGSQNTLRQTQASIAVADPIQETQRAPGDSRPASQHAKGWGLHRERRLMPVGRHPRGHGSIYYSKVLRFCTEGSITGEMGTRTMRSKISSVLSTVMIGALCAWSDPGFAVVVEPAPQDRELARIITREL